MDFGELRETISWAGLFASQYLTQLEFCQLHICSTFNQVRQKKRQKYLSRQNHRENESNFLIYNSNVFSVIISKQNSAFRLTKSYILFEHSYLTNMSKSYLLGQVLSLPVSKQRGFPSETQILVDGVSQNIASIVKQSYEQTFAKASKSLEEQSKAVIDFTYLLQERLPFLGAKNYVEFFDQSLDTQMVTISKYIRSFSQVRPLSELTKKRELDCMGHCLSIAYVLNDKSWNLVQSVENLRFRDKKKRHVALARECEGMYLIMDTSGCPNKDDLLAESFFTIPPDILRRNYTPIFMLTNHTNSK